MVSIGPKDSHKGHALSATILSVEIFFLPESCTIQDSGHNITTIPIYWLPCIVMLSLVEKLCQSNSNTDIV